MNFYNQLKDIFNYLVSIRNLEGYIAIDIEFPNTWKLLKKYVDETKVVEQKIDKANKRLFTFATNFEEREIEKIIENIKNIIEYNKEREEKEKLFESKVAELKQFFSNTKLSDLQTLTFNVSPTEKIFVDTDENEGGQNT